MKGAVPDILLVAGGLTIAGGIYLVNVPAAVITVGLLLISLAVLREMAEARRGGL